MLQVFEVEADGPPGFSYDEEWLAVLRTTHGLVNLRPQHLVTACSNSDDLKQNSIS